MATRGRPRSPDGPKTAAARKSDFDRRMRNADGRFGGEPARTPVALYLSAEAREVMRRHRDEAALAGAPPLLDSKLVEALLLAFQSHRSAGSANPVEAAAASVDESSPPPANDGDIRRLRVLREKIRRQDNSKKRADGESSTASGHWSAVRRALLDQHRTEASRLLFPLAQRLHSTLGELNSDAERMRAVNDEVIEYLLTLLDALDRPSANSSS